MKSQDKYINYCSLLAKKGYLWFLFIILNLILLPNDGLAQSQQDDNPSFLLKKTISTVNSDSRDNADNTIDSNEKTTETMPHSMSKSPTGAIWRSLVVPGWGQLYTGDYWKAPLFFGASATLVYIILWNNSKFLDSQREIDNWTENSSTTQFSLKQKREFYRDQRDISALYLTGVYVLAAVDAYVNAHLFDFNVDDVSCSIAASPSKCGGVSLNFVIKSK